MLDVAPEPTGRRVADATIENAITVHDLSDDQGAAVRALLTDERRIGLLIGPAGAGKTRTLRAVVDAWEHTNGPVIGLTVSQAAANVLAGEAEVRAENTAKWLYETRRGRWHVPPGALVLLDEASMVATSDLVGLVEQARRASGKVLLVGDPAQLAAIHIGGAFDLLAERHGATRLREVRRFTEPWEREASLLLRRRDPAALAEYAMRDRIHAGTTCDIDRQLFDAWRADTLSPGGERGRRRSVLMIVATNEHAAVLSERARHALLASGTVSDGPAAQLRDNIASVGDHILTRHNDRRLRSSNGGWVVNGDVWTVLAVHPDGALDTRRHGDGATVTLPADYLADHAHLPYALAAHRAQGMTVDVCHAAVTADATHEQLYVAATRGREGNHVWVITDSNHDVVRDPDDLPAAEHVLARVLERRNPDRRSSHHTIADSLQEVGSLARLGAVFEDSARAATDQWLRQHLSSRGLPDAKDEPEWRTLVARVRQAALAGYDVTMLIDEAIDMRAIDDAHSTAAVLHWRLGVLAADSAPVRLRSPLSSLPPVEGPETEVAQQAGDLMRQRWRQLRTELSRTTGGLPWATELGPRPSEPDEASAWLTAATAITAYRERYDVPEHTEMVGEKPPVSRPDARAAWEHARLQADRYLSRRLRDLNDEQLAELDARMASTIRDVPRFDPSDLELARQRINTAQRAARAASAAPTLDERHARRRVRELERAAKSHADSRRRAGEASDARRRIALERQRRSKPSRTLRRVY